MASARQLARLVSVLGTISSGAIRTQLGRTPTTRQGLGLLPKAMRLISESIATKSADSDDGTREVAAYLSRLILRYGTMRRAMEALAHERRRHPSISGDRAKAWHEAMAVGVGSLEPTLRRHPWLRVHLSRWLGEQSGTIDDDMAALEAWFDGPLPGSDDEGEFPVLAQAASGEGASGAVAPEDDDVGGDVIDADDAPEGVTGPGAETDDTRAALALLASLKRPGGAFGERALGPNEIAIVERLRVSAGAFERAVACVIDRDLATAQRCVRMCAGDDETPGMMTLRANLLYFADRCDEATPVFRAALAAASGGSETWCMVDLAMSLVRMRRGSEVDRAREARELLAAAEERCGEGGEAWARIRLQRGLAELAPPHVDRLESVTRAIELMGSAAAALPADRNDGWRAEAMFRLGCALLEQHTGDRAAAVERAIARFNDTLGLIRRSETPQRWGAVMMEMGIAWDRMPASNRAESLEHAIGCFTSALAVYRKETDAVGWARIQNNLGNLWVQFPGGNQRQNIERAIAHQQAALEVWSLEDRRLEWATTQSNLGNAWALLPAEEGERERNLRRSISCYKSALQVRTRASHPLEWATTQNNLGSALLHLPVGSRGANVREAIACYEQALEVRTKDRFPLEWAKTRANIGNAWMKLPTGYRADNIAQAVTHYQAALGVYDASRFPRQSAVISKRLREAQRELREF